MIGKMKEILRDRAGDQLASVNVGTTTQSFLSREDAAIPVITATWKDGTIEELRLFYDPNLLVAELAPNADVRSLELFVNREYEGAWNVVDGEIQW